MGAAHGAVLRVGERQAVVPRRVREVEARDARRGVALRARELAEALHAAAPDIVQAVQETAQDALDPLAANAHPAARLQVPGHGLAPVALSGGPMHCGLEPAAQSAPAGCCPRFDHHPGAIITGRLLISGPARLRSPQARCKLGCKDARHQACA